MTVTEQAQAHPHDPEIADVCHWLLEREVSDTAASHAGVLEVALRRADDPSLRQALQEQARAGARSGRSLGVALGMANERLNVAFGEYTAVLASAAAISAQHRRFSRFQESVLGAIAKAHERPRRHPRPAPSNPEASLEAIKQINAAANSSLDLKQTTQLTARAIAEVMGLDECSVFILDEETNRLVLHATFGLNPELVGQISMAIGEGITGAAAELGKPIAVRDAWADPRFRFFPNLREEQYRSILAVPIVLFTVSRLMGVLSMHSREYRDFTAGEIGFVETAAGQLSMAMWNARLYEQTDAALHQRINELATLQRVGQAITSSLDYRKVLDAIVGWASTIIKADKAAIFELDPATGVLLIVASHGLGEGYTRLRLRAGEGVVGQVVATRQPIIVADALTDPRLAVSKEQILSEGYQSMACVPLVARGRVLGGISVYTLERHEFGQEEVRLVQAFADQAAIAMENAMLYDQTRRALEHNTLLMRELHHRVKNSLQTVASLLSLQARHARSKEATDLLNLSSGRIAGIVAVHDLLSRRNLNVTSVTEVASVVCDMARADVTTAGKNIRISVEGEQIELGADKATVVGLALNELIWNAISHGFAGRDSGSIGIDVRGLDGLAQVTVRDDGAGLPAGFDLGDDAGLGLNIIGQLVTSDLRGSFDIRSEGGTVATLTFRP